MRSISNLRIAQGRIWLKPQTRREVIYWGVVGSVFMVGATKTVVCTRTRPLVDLAANKGSISMCRRRPFLGRLLLWLAVNYVDRPPTLLRGDRAPPTPGAGPTSILWHVDSGAFWWGRSPNTSLGGGAGRRARHSGLATADQYMPGGTRCVISWRRLHFGGIFYSVRMDHFDAPRFSQPPLRALG